MMKLLFLFLVGVWSGFSQAADVYKWLDAEGHAHYSDQPPPPSARMVERKSAKGNLIESDALPYETQQVAKKFPVVLYSFPECGDACSSGEAYLTGRGVPFTLKNSDPDKAELQKMTGDNQVPVLIVGSQPLIKGFSRERWGRLLDLAGYPKSNPLSKFKKTPVYPTAVPSPANKEN